MENPGHRLGGGIPDPNGLWKPPGSGNRGDGSHEAGPKLPPAPKQPTRKGPGYDGPATLDDVPGGRSNSGNGSSGDGPGNLRPNQGNSSHTQIETAPPPHEPGSGKDSGSGNGSRPDGGQTVPPVGKEPPAAAPHTKEAPPTTVAPEPKSPAPSGKEGKQPQNGKSTSETTTEPAPASSDKGKGKEPATDEGKGKGKDPAADGGKGKEPATDEGKGKGKEPASEEAPPSEHVPPGEQPHEQEGSGHGPGLSEFDKVILAHEINRELHRLDPRRPPVRPGDVDELHAQLPHWRQRMPLRPRGEAIAQTMVTGKPLSLPGGSSHSGSGGYSRTSVFTDPREQSRPPVSSSGRRSSRRSYPSPGSVQRPGLLSYPSSGLGRRPIAPPAPAPRRQPSSSGSRGQSYAPPPSGSSRQPYPPPSGSSRQPYPPPSSSRPRTPVSDIGDVEMMDAPPPEHAPFYAPTATVRPHGISDRHWHDILEAQRISDRWHTDYYRRMGLQEEAIRQNLRNQGIPVSPHDTLPFEPLPREIELLNFGHEVFADVRRILHGGQSNQASSVAATGGALQIRLSLARQVAPREQPRNTMEQLGQSAATASITGTGNCGEHAALTYTLVNRHRLPDGMRIWYVPLNLHRGERGDNPVAPYTDHVFIAVGYPERPRNIVMLDPWEVNATPIFAGDPAFRFPFLVGPRNAPSINPRAVLLPNDGIDYLAIGHRQIGHEVHDIMDFTGTPLPASQYQGVYNMYQDFAMPSPVRNMYPAGPAWDAYFAHRHPQQPGLIRPGGPSGQPSGLIRPGGPSGQPSGLIRPSGSSSRPSSSSGRPSSSSGRPSSSSGRPAGPSRQPSGMSRQPSGSSRRPSGSSRQPGGSSGQPSGSSRRPSGSSRRPSMPWDQPGGPARTVGGSPDTGIDPIREQWGIGRVVTLAEPRSGTGLVRGPAPEAGPRTTGRPGEFAVFDLPLPPADTPSSSRPLGYEVDPGGWIRLPDGSVLSPGGWVSFGDDFIHTPTGAIMHGDSGWIGEVGNIEQIAETWHHFDPSAAPHLPVPSGDGLHMVPVHPGDQAVHIPLRPRTDSETQAAAPIAHPSSGTPRPRGPVPTGTSGTAGTAGTAGTSCSPGPSAKGKEPATEGTSGWDETPAAAWAPVVRPMAPTPSAVPSPPAQGTSGHGSDLSEFDQVVLAQDINTELHRLDATHPPVTVADVPELHAQLPDWRQRMPLRPRGQAIAQMIVTGRPMSLPGGSSSYSGSGGYSRTTVYTDPREESRPPVSSSGRRSSRRSYPSSGSVRRTGVLSYPSSGFTRRPSRESSFAEPSRQQYPSSGSSRQQYPPSAGSSRQPYPPTAGSSRQPYPPSAGSSRQPYPPTAGSSRQPYPPSAGPSRPPARSFEPEDVEMADAPPSPRLPSWQPAPFYVPTATAPPPGMAPEQWFAIERLNRQSVQWHTNYYAQRDAAEAASRGGRRVGMGDPLPPDMLPSEPLQNELWLMDLGHEIFAGVREILHGGQSNQASSVAATGGALLVRNHLARQVPRVQPRNIQESLGQSAAQASLVNTGNCGEHAALTYVLLNRRQLPPGMRIWHVPLNLHPGEHPLHAIAPYTDHVFIAVGYPERPRNIVLLDPWEVNATPIFAGDPAFPFPFLVGPRNAPSITPRAVPLPHDGVDYLNVGLSQIDTGAILNIMDFTGTPVAASQYEGLYNMYQDLAMPSPVRNMYPPGHAWDVYFAHRHPRIPGSTRPIGGSSGRPGSSSGRPGSSSRRPSVSLSQPGGLSRRSSVSSGRPSGLSRQPSGMSGQPSGSSSRPSGSWDRPGGSSGRPSGSSSRPSGSSSRPSGSSGRPGSSAGRPSGSWDLPGNRWGARGGSPDVGIDPIREQWGIGRVVTLMEPRSDTGLVRVPAPAAGPRTADRPGEFAVFDLPLPPADTPSSSRPLGYEVDPGGWIRLPDGTVLSPGGWVSFGDDFIHTPTGMIMYGDSGWIGEVGNIEQVAEVWDELDPSATAYVPVLSGDGLHMVPALPGDEAVHVPVTPRTGTSFAAPRVRAGADVPPGKGKEPATDQAPAAGEVPVTYEAPVTEQAPVSRPVPDEAVVPAVPAMPVAVRPSLAAPELPSPARSQEDRLAERGLAPLYILDQGDAVTHALTAVAPVESGRLVGHGRPAGSQELRDTLADALVTDAQRPPGERRLWPPLTGLTAPGRTAPLVGSEEAAVEAVRTGTGSDDADWLVLAVAAPVLGLRVTVLTPDGTPWTTGPDDGRPVLLFQQADPAPYTARWAATEPVGGVPEQRPVPPVSPLSAPELAPAPAPAPASSAPDRHVAATVPSSPPSAPLRLGFGTAGGPRHRAASGGEPAPEVFFGSEPRPATRR
ncbi:hypothetical protein ACIO6U_29320 [Streptomyces sp. NPDC087422]|uniref:hypothetical protein n=1 Tax=Streptomyces sp. NPDC087422 TaxID=3365786 RepID=UPI0038113233